MEIVRIAFRNLSRQKKRSFLLGGAVAFGIMIVTLIDGCAGALVGNISRNFADLVAGHVFVEGVKKSDKGRDLSLIQNDAVLMEALADSGIHPKAITKRSAFEGQLIFEGKAATLSVSGVDFAEESFLRERLIFAEGGIEAMADPHGLIISEPIAARINARVGDRVIVQLATYTGQQNSGDFTIAAIVKDPGILGSLSGYANLAFVNELVNLKPGEYQTFGLYLEGMEGMDEAGDALYAALKGKAQVFDRDAAERERNPVMAMMRSAQDEEWEGLRYRVYTLNDMLAQLQEMVAVLNQVSLGVLLVLFTIIMVGITNTFRMVMYERVREIGTMRAVGMRRGYVRGLFLLEALFLATGAAIVGIGLAQVVMAIVSLIDFGPNSAFFIVLDKGHAGFSLGFGKAALNVLIVAALTLLAALFPANAAARLDPAVALRTSK